MYNNIIPNAAIEGLSVLDITNWIISGSRIPSDVRANVMANASASHQEALIILERMFDYTAEAFLRRLQEDYK